MTGPNLRPTRFPLLILRDSRGFLITRIGRGWPRKPSNAFRVQLSRSPSSLPQMLVALDASASSPRQVVIAGKPDAFDTQALLQEVNKRYQPNEMILADGGRDRRTPLTRLSFLKIFIRSTRRQRPTSAKTSFVSYPPATQPS